MQVVLHDLRGAQQLLHVVPLLSGGDAPTATGLQDVAPLAALCLPLDSEGKDALTAAIDQLAQGSTSTASDAAPHDFGAALQACPCPASISCGVAATCSRVHIEVAGCNRCWGLIFRQ